MLTGGGTGGHLYPAISLAHALARRQQAARTGVASTAAPDRLAECCPVFIGTAMGLEARVIPEAGFEFYAVSSRKITRSRSPAAVLSLASIVWGAVQAGCLLRRLAPVAVIGTGGYASAGVVLAAALQGIPTLIHEQNSIPGRTNRLLARWVRRVALTFAESAAYFPTGKSVVTGLPVRPEIMEGDRRRAVERFGLDPDRPTLLVLGGSLGARSLNQAVRDSLPLWSNSGPQILHQVGRGNWEAHQQAVRGAPAWYHPLPYLETMGDAYAAADLVCCRAGSTVAEVAVAGLPAILVPYPHAHADHQLHNARSVVSAGAAVLVPDNELSGARLTEEVQSLLGDPSRLATMAGASRRLGRPGAAAAILDAVADMVDARHEAASADQGAKRGAA